MTWFHRSPGQFFSEYRLSLLLAGPVSGLWCSFKKLQIYITITLFSEIYWDASGTDPQRPGGITFVAWTCQRTVSSIKLTRVFKTPFTPPNQKKNCHRQSDRHPVRCHFVCYFRGRLLMDISVYIWHLKPTETTPCQISKRFLTLMSPLLIMGSQWSVTVVLTGHPSYQVWLAKGGVERINTEPGCQTYRNVIEHCKSFCRTVR